MALAQSSVPVQPRVAAPRFDAADQTWEQASETAVRAYRAGGANGALVHWRRALAIARDRFEPGDPRLATSLANYAFALRRLGHAYESRHHFALAEDAFAASWRWVHRMTPAGAPDGRYGETAIERFERLVASVRSTVRAIEARDELPIELLERWRLDRPMRGSDLRKLLAASLLLVSRPAPTPH